MKNKFLLLAILFLLPFYIQVSAQETSIYKDPGAGYNLAMELFTREKYGAAQKIFEDLIQNAKIENAMLVNAQYYAAVCGMRLANSDAGDKLEAFLTKNPTSSKTNPARFYLGNFYYSNKAYKQALAAYQTVDTHELSGNETGEYFFKTGYCHYDAKQTEKAKNNFYEVKDSKSKYAPDATYYYSHIAYTEGKYETALQGFNKVVKNETYAPLVPYYITQIYYRQGKYDELLSVAPGLLPNTTGKQKADIARMIGDAYFKKGDYPQAYDYLMIHRQLSKGNPGPAEAYAIGYAAYKAGKYTEAIQFLQIPASGKDSVANNALYHLGDCYLKTNQKDFAQKSFYSAYQLAYDQTTKEDALFNYAKLSYELSSDPYNEAITALKQYLTEYPSTRRADEANQYLVNLALITKNYKDALEALDQIKSKDIKIKTVYQRVLYYRGIELFNAREYLKSIELFDKAGTLNHDKTIKTMVLYWTGEAYFRLGQYTKATGFYNKFLVSPGAIDMKEYIESHYNIGYCYFKTGNYDQAGISFRKFVQSTKSKDPVMQNDACLRTGDCFFISKKYTEAQDYYSKVINAKGFDSDYAYYQIALAQGVQKKFSEKNTTLKTLVTKFPKSPYTDDAWYEMALTNLILNQNNEALDNLQKIISNYPNSNFQSKAMLRKGLVYYNTNQNDLALKQLKMLVDKYPGTPDAKEALVTISNIYVELNQVPEYLAYVQKVPFAEVSMSKQDSLLYIATENQYLKGDCDKSVKGFNDYLQKYPDGLFATSAAYYLAECSSLKGNQDEALAAYEKVASKPQGKYTEKSVANAASIHFSKGNHARALVNYRRLERLAGSKSGLLEALQGQMRCYYNLKNYDSTIVAGSKLMASEKVTADNLIEAHYYLGKSAFISNNMRMAEKEFQILKGLTKNELAAEATYHLGLIQYNNKDLTNAEKTIFELINKFPTYDFWRVKGFILLSDIYLDNGNVFQAKQTLQSVLDNYEGEDLKEIAREKLAKIQ